MKKICLNFGESTSLKAVPKWLKYRKTSPFLSVLWFLAFSIGLSIWIWFVYNLSAEYFSYPTYLKTWKVNKEVRFPDITVCNLQPLQSTQVDSLEAFYKLMFSLPEQNANGSLYDTFVSPLGWFFLMDRAQIEDTVLDINKFVHSCSISLQYGLKQDCKDMITKVSMLNIRRQKCVTFQSNFSVSIMEKMDGLLLTFYLDDFADVSNPFYDTAFEDYDHGIEVAVHAPGTLPCLDYAFHLPPGISSKIVFSATQSMRLSGPYGLCTDRQVVDLKKHAHGNQYRYSKRACDIECIQHHIRRRCGCVSMLLPHILNDSVIFCEGVSEKNWDCYLTTVNTVIKGTYRSMCNCLLPCEEFTYNSQMSVARWPHESYHLAFYREQIKHARYAARFSIYGDIEKTMQYNKTAAFRQLRSTDLIRRNFVKVHILYGNSMLTVESVQPLITLAGLVSNIGGICNLWIGLTFFTFFEFFEMIYAFVVTYCCRKITVITNIVSDIKK